MRLLEQENNQNKNERKSDGQSKKFKIVSSIIFLL